MRSQSGSYDCSKQKNHNRVQLGEVGEEEHPSLYSHMLEGHEVKSKKVSSCTDKEDVPESNMAIICTPMIEWYVVRVDLRTNTKKAPRV